MSVLLKVCHLMRLYVLLKNDPFFLHFSRFFLLCLAVWTNLLKSFKRKTWMSPLTWNSMMLMLFSKICNKKQKTSHFNSSPKHLVLSFFFFFFFRVMGPYSLDVMTSASFSIKADSINNPDDPLVAHLKNITNFRLLPLLVACMYLDMSATHRALFNPAIRKEFISKQQQLLTSFCSLDSDSPLWYSSAEPLKNWLHSQRQCGLFPQHHQEIQRETSWRWICKAITCRQ